MIDLFRPFVAQDAKRMVADVLTPQENGRLYIGQGPKVDEYESQFEKLVEAPWDVLALNSCTSALDLAMYLAGVGPRTEVITTPQTCTASNSPIVTRGATIVWADIDPITGLIDPKDVERKITDRTVAIVSVDWAGRACDYRLLTDLALPVIEDAAHAMLARYNDESIAQSGGHYVCWSTQAIKHLTTIDGGVLLAPYNETERARLLRWYGLDRQSKKNFRCEQNIEEPGFKYHMNDVNATIGLANIPYVKNIVDAQRIIARLYTDRLQGLKGVTLAPYDPGCSYWLFTLLVDERASFETFLKARGIETSQVHARNDTHSGFMNASKNPFEKRPGVDYFSSRQISIPVGWWVTLSEVDYICEAIADWSSKL